MRTRFSKLAGLWRLVVVASLVLATAPAFAALSSYTFATSNQAYTPLASGTLMIPGTNQSQTNPTGTFNDGLDGGLQSIGFDFCFDGVFHNQFTAYTGGVFTLGSNTIPNSNTPNSPRYANDLAAAGAYPVIAPWWDHQHTFDNGGAANGCNFNPPAGVRYLLSGAVPARTLTLEWNTQVADTNNSFWWAGCNLTMNRYQAVLREGTDVIEFRYGSLWASSGQPTSSTIGLAVGAANFLSATPTGGTATVSSVTSNNSIAAHTASIPANTVYTFQPPAKSSTTTTATGPAGTLFGQSATIVATVTGVGTPAGKVHFFEGATALGSVTVVGGQASVMLNLPVGSHTITATYAGDCTGTPSSGSFTYTVAPQADLSITKTNGSTTSTPGTSTTYTIVAANAGPSAVTGATVADTFPAACASVSYTSVTAGGATGNTAGPASGNINDAALSLPVGASVTYTAICNIALTATGTLANTATISSSATDPNPANNSATDTDTLIQLATLTIQLDAPGSAPTTFAFTTVGLTPAAFSLQHGQTQTFTNLIPGQSYVVNDQPPPPGWVLDEVLCSAPAPQCVISSITLTPTEGQSVTGTFRFLRLTDAAEAIPIFSVWGLGALIGLFGLALARLRRRV
jgi:uncharacterized repeat protein (TIGR01451 family)